MEKAGFFAIVVFSLLLFGGILYLFIQPTDLNGWICLLVMLMINPGLMLGFIATTVDW